MNVIVFLDWCEHQRLPWMDTPSVIVMDNTSYHNISQPETRTQTTEVSKQQFKKTKQLMIILFQCQVQLTEKIRVNKTPIQYKMNNL